MSLNGFISNLERIDVRLPKEIVKVNIKCVEKISSVFYSFFTIENV